MPRKIEIRLKTTGQPQPKKAQDKPQQFVYYWHRIIPAVIVLIAALYGLVVGVGHLFGPDAKSVAQAPTLASTAETAKTPPIANQTAGQRAVVVPESKAQYPAEPPAFNSQSTVKSLASSVSTPAQPGAGVREGVKAEELGAAASRPGEVSANGSSKTLPPSVRSMQLSRGQVDGKPVGPIQESVPMNTKGLIKVFLFTELSGFQGQVVYHDWYWKDRLMAHARVPVHNPEQRSFTSKFIDRIMVGPWHVRLVDKNKQVLGELKFEVRK